MTKRRLEITEYSDFRMDYREHLGSISKKILKLIEKYGEDAEIQCSYDSSGYHDYTTIYINRLETDEEYAKRLAAEDREKRAKKAKEKIAKKQQEETEYKLYLELHEKFGKENKK